jgi:hypothetical protein
MFTFDGEKVINKEAILVEWSACSLCSATIGPKDECYDYMVTKQRWSEEPVTEELKVDTGVFVPLTHEKGFVDHLIIPPYDRLCKSCFEKARIPIHDARRYVRREIRKTLAGAIIVISDEEPTGLKLIAIKTLKTLQRGTVRCHTKIVDAREKLGEIIPLREIEDQD